MHDFSVTYGNRTAIDSLGRSAKLLGIAIRGKNILLPLHVCVGAAVENNRATKIFDDYILGKRAAEAFQW